MEFKPIAELNRKRSRSGKIRLAVLGATGSIGRQTLDIAASEPDSFEVTAISVNRNIADAEAICIAFRPKYVVVCDRAKAAELRRILADEGLATEVLAGEEALSDIASLAEVDLVVTATVGYSGFLPTLAAIQAGKDIALANKETLVVGGEYIRKLIARSKSRIYPIDSEHSAIAQCLVGEDLNAVSKLILTASGGPFRTLTAEQLKSVTAADALKHPNWAMGAKITVDSATMMNKAFEIIEAHYLYGLPAEKIRAVVHPQSIVHSMVEFYDGAVKAQLGVPDMHLPIAYALGMNNRMRKAVEPLSLTDMATLTFERPDTEKFPCLRLAETALERKGNSACVINAANEIAVDAFLHDRIKFTDIYNIIEETLEKIDFISEPGPDDFVATNKESRIYASSLVKR